MAVGVNVLFKLTEMASRVLGPEFDVEVLESHHRFKKDAPSGTAKELVKIIKDNMRGMRDAAEVNGREGITGERTNKEIGIMAIRGGDIVGEHTVYFIGKGERIELTIRSTSRENLATGAVLAGEFLPGKAAGLYTMYDVLGLK
jgi:4-hydroxy-tetrahydrodipicolinate reductase